VNASHAQRRAATEQWRQAIAGAEQRKLQETASLWQSQSASQDAAFGLCREAQLTASRVSEPSRAATWNLGLAFAMCGNSAKTAAIIDDLSKVAPKSTLTNGVAVPLMRAAMEMHRGQPAEAIRLLETARQYERGAGFRPNYLRGLANVQANQGAAARVEFQRILDHRGEGVYSPLYPLSFLGLARAAAMVGDRTASRKAYEDFLALWKDADTDLPPVVEAKKEYAALIATN
jgi:hypothetical protein